MSARLFQNLREKEGLAYDVGSMYATRRGLSGFVFYMGLQASRLAEAQKRIMKELEQLKDHKVPDDEIQQTTNYIKGSFILDHQTNSQRAHYLGWWSAVGLPPSYDWDYPEKLSSVNADDLIDVAQRTFSAPFVSVVTRPDRE